MKSINFISFYQKYKLFFLQLNSEILFLRKHYLKAKIENIVKRKKNLRTILEFFKICMGICLDCVLISDKAGRLKLMEFIMSF